MLKTFENFLKVSSASALKRNNNFVDGFLKALRPGDNKEL